MRHISHDLQTRKVLRVQTALETASYNTGSSGAWCNPEKDSPASDQRTPAIDSPPFMPGCSSRQHGLIVEVAARTIPVQRPQVANSSCQARTWHMQSADVHLVEKRVALFIRSFQILRICGFAFARSGPGAAVVVPCDTQLCDKDVATTEWQPSGVLMARLPAASNWVQHGRRLRAGRHQETGGWDRWVSEKGAFWSPGCCRWWCTAAPTCLPAADLPAPAMSQASESCWHSG